MKTRVQELEGEIKSRKETLATLKKEVGDAKRVRTTEEKETWSTLKSEIEDFEDQLKEAKEDAAKKIETSEEVKSIYGGGGKDPKEEKKKDDPVDFAKQVDDNLVKLRKTISSNLSEQNEVHFDTRATVTAASIASNSDAQANTQISPLAHRKLKLYDLFNKVPVAANSNGVVKYTDWDDATKVRAAAMIAESGTFPSSTAKWIERNISLKKVGDSIPITEESLYDRQRYTSELSNFLQTNVDLVVDQGIYNGDGTGNNLKGIYESAGTYAAAASGIADASIYDLLVKVRTALEQGVDSKFSANVAIMNRTDIDMYKLKKDANNNYVMPPFVDRNGQIVDGMLVIESNTVTANTLVVGDSRFGLIYEIPGVYVGTGLVNNQYLEDLITMKVRRRLALLIKVADEGAFKKVTSISAALVTLAT